MRKKALLALMLVLTLLLSGCTLIVKDQAVDNATEIIRMGDRVVTKKEVKKTTRRSRAKKAEAPAEEAPAAEAPAAE